VKASSKVYQNPADIIY